MDAQLSAWFVPRVNRLTILIGGSLGQFDWPLPEPVGPVPRVDLQRIVNEIMVVRKAEEYKGTYPGAAAIVADTYDRINKVVTKYGSGSLPRTSFAHGEDGSQWLESKE